MLTIPKRLRAYCLYRRRLLGEIARVAARTVTAAIRTLTGEQDLAVGIVACLQTHGSRANWHPHLHLLVTDGGFRPDGTFVSWPAHDRTERTVTYRCDKSEGPTAGTETADPLEFLARVLAHIPDKGQVTTRYYGWYANRPRPARPWFAACGDDRPRAPRPATPADQPTTTPEPHAGASRRLQSLAILPQSRLNFLSRGDKPRIPLAG